MFEKKTPTAEQWKQLERMFKALPKDMSLKDRAEIISKMLK